MTDSLIDTVVAQYQVLSRLGGGAMGVVYKARDLKLGRYVALKFLPHEWSHDDDAKQRFVREAQAASSTDHANICTVHDIQSTDDGRLFIVMAFYDGESLKQRLARAPLSVAEALDIATQVADGLARAHTAGVVHRDVKPGNVMLTEDAAKIVDFGLATLAGSVQLTQAGSPMGTVTYMAPEQLRGLAATPQSDVWAVGVMLYEMLSGHPPFQGAYAEAISYAIRHETPLPLREARPDISEEVEQLVFRALHKEPGVRFASGRELARALRQVQGQTVPLDLRTEQVQVPQAAWRRRTRRHGRAIAGAVAAAVLLVAVAAWYATRPVVRTFVAVAPVANATGDRTLDPYRLGLTFAMTRELAESSRIRVLPYQRLLLPLRRFMLEQADVSSADAIRAVSSASGAAVVVAPVLLYDRGAWKARADLTTADGAPLGRVETAPIESSLTKEAAATLVASLASRVAEQFGRPRWTLTGTASPPMPFQSLEAVRAMEEGLNAYDAGEYAEARDAFARAAREDPRHPLPVAWQTRVAQIVGDRTFAAQAADRAAERLTGAAGAERLFVEAVVAEARRQDREALSRYEALASSHPDDPAGLIELAGFQDRSGRTADAVASYRRVITMDSRFPGPALELCRLYNSTRMNEAGRARTFGEQARQAYRKLGSAPGEAQAMLCLADILRFGRPNERAEAQTLAMQALKVFDERGLRYGLGRAQHYVALAARAQDDLAAAAASWEQALANAKAIGNTLLEGIVYINLGVTYTALGQRAKAIDFYRQSYETAERRGDERTAAYSRANAGALLIEYGDQPDEGLRFIEGALRVVRRLDDKNFEVFCLQLIAAHERFTGLYAESRRDLDQAMTIAHDRNFVDAIPGLLLDSGRVSLETSRYVEARDTFMKALTSEGATKAAELLIDLARAHAMLGDVTSARDALGRAKQAPDANSGDIVPRMKAATGEIAFAAGDMKAARSAFEEAARLWVDDRPDAASVESRAYVGLLDGLAGRAMGRAAITASLQQAQKMRRPALETTARVFLARLDLQAGQAASALAGLEGIDMARIGPELEAQVHAWRGAAHAALGMTAAAVRERRDAARLRDTLQQAVPEELRERFLSRPDIQTISQ
ncbi:MAG TPA: protein kinase [Vicinamibacterales bacterium]|nr:protein kinase [Vicinamibacterales bacterium]